MNAPKKLNGLEHSEQKRQKDADAFPVIGLGASAGGLKALQQFFEQMPANSGMAFVVILHLSPQHESHADTILQNSTKMPVRQVNESVKVEPNRVYVIPPTKHLSMMDGFIALSEPERPLGRHVAIDLFFRTLAETHRANSACIVLSGTGSDGSVGLTRIKEEGGIAIAQDPGEAEYDAMPRNAISTGKVDFVLPVAQMPNKLIEIWRNSKIIRLPEEGLAPVVDERQQAEEALREVLGAVRTRTGHDFTHYKRATVLRRIERRMQVTTTPDLPAYRDYLRQNPPEAKLLLQDLLIGVTNFFRDPAAWQTLESKVIPALFAGKQHGDIVRVWVAGCATGEEAYSLTMLLLEYAATLPQSPEIQVFATDIDEEAIATAREGKYPISIAADVTPARLKQFFSKEDGSYRINKEVRDRVLFAIHNLIKDPPFSRLDLISCRNLLIYLTREVQQQVFDLFHFALRPNGFLFLGGSESADGASELFTPSDKKHRIFRANTLVSPLRSMPALPFRIPIGARNQIEPEGIREHKLTAFRELHQRLLEQYAPPSVIINSDYEIVHLSEHAGRFLRLGGGEPTLNLLKTIMPELRLELRTALFQAVQTGRSTEARRVRVLHNENATYVNIVVRPAADIEAGSHYFLVLFDEVEETLGIKRNELTVNPAEPIVQQLEAETHRLKEQLQAVVEQYETTVEELKASNEELQAINEELRSTTEELETGKEELQSVNEELRTVNQELKDKVDEVNSTNSDLKNLMFSTDIATIFMDRALRIKRFTPRALDIFNLIPTDEGRQLTDITHKLNYENILADAEEVLKTLHRIEREVTNRDGRTYLARLLPYRTLSDRIEGVVVNFVDITERKQSEKELRLAKELAEKTFDTVREAMLVLDVDLRVLSANDSFYHHFQMEPAETLGRLVYKLGNGQWDIPHLRELLEGVLPENKQLSNFEIQHNFPGLGQRSVILNAQRVDHLQIILLAIEDITERKQAKEELLKAHSLMQERSKELQNANIAMQSEIAKRMEFESERQRLLRRIVESQEDERRRISRELHDSFGQQLTVLRLGLELLQKHDQEQPGKRISDLLELIKRLDSEVDFLARELRPIALDELGLSSALRNFLEEWSLLFNIPVKFHSDDLSENEISPEVETSLYRIAQEAINNISKHAQATRVAVVIERREKQIVLIIEDNGIGFAMPDIEISNSEDKGLGIIGMRERSALVGGTLEIESSPGNGTTVFVRVPLKSGDAKN